MCKSSVYKEVSSDQLLKRCLGGYTQNQNKSFNNAIWCLAPKSSFSRITIVKIVIYIAVSIFNKGYSSILLIMSTTNITIGPVVAALCGKLDEEETKTTNRRSFENIKEGRNDHVDPID